LLPEINDAHAAFSKYLENFVGADGFRVLEGRDLVAGRFEKGAQLLAIRARERFGWAGLLPFPAAAPCIRAVAFQLVWSQETPIVEGVACFRTKPRKN
jgi:hypothetical protein